MRSRAATASSFAAFSSSVRRSVLASRSTQRLVAALLLGGARLELLLALHHALLERGDLGAPVAELGLDLGAHAVHLFFGLETGLLERRSRPRAWRRAARARPRARRSPGCCWRGSGGSGTRGRHPPQAPAPRRAQSCQSHPFKHVRARKRPGGRPACSRLLTPAERCSVWHSMPVRRCDSGRSHLPDLTPWTARSRLWNTAPGAVGVLQALHAQVPVTGTRARRRVTR